MTPTQSLIIFATSFLLLIFFLAALFEPGTDTGFLPAAGGVLALSACAFLLSYL